MQNNPSCKVRRLGNRSGRIYHFAVFVQRPRSQSYHLSIPAPVLAETWKDFIHSHHYRTVPDFYRSFIAKHPRRSCEAMWSCLMQVDPYRDNDIPRDLNFESLYKWYNPLLEAEKIKNNT